MTISDFVQGIVIRFGVTGQEQVAAAGASVDKLKASAAAASPAVDSLGKSVGASGTAAASAAQAMESLIGQQTRAVGVVNATTEATKRSTVGMTGSAAANMIELQAIDAKTKIMGVAAGKYDAATLAAIGFKVAVTETGNAAGAAGAQVSMLESMMTRMIIRFVIFTAVLRPILEGIRELVKDHADWNEAMQVTGAQLRGLGDQATVTTAQVTAFAKENASLGKFLDTELAQSFNTIVERTHSSAGAFALVRDAMDLSAASGAKLSDTSKALADAIEGNIKPVQNLGVAFSDHEKDLLKVADADQRMLLVHSKVQEQYAHEAERMQPAILSWKTFVGLLGDGFEKIRNLQGITSKGIIPNIAASLGLGYIPGVAGLFNDRKPDTTYTGPGGGGGWGEAEGAQQTRAGLEGKIVAENDDKFQHVVGTLEKYENGLDKVGKKQAEIRLQFADLNKVIDEQEAVLIKGGKAGEGAIAELENHRSALMRSEAAQLAAAAAGDGLEKSISKADAAFLRNTGIVAGDAEQIRQLQQRYSELAEKADASPYEQGMMRATAATQSLLDATNHELVELAKHGDMLSSNGAAALVLRDSLEALIKSEKEHFDAKYLTRALDEAENKMLELTRRAKEFSLSLPGNLGADFNAQMGNLNAGISAGTTGLQILLGQGVISPAQFVQFQKGLTDAAGQFEKDMEKAYTASGATLKKILDESFANLGSVIEAAITGGGAGIEKSLSGIFSNVTKEFSTHLANAFIVGIGGQPDPNAYQGGKNNPDYQAAAAIGDASKNAIVNASLIAGSGIVTAVENGSKETVAQMAISAAATGYAVALALEEVPYGQIAGVIVAAATLLAGLLTPSSTAGKYYEHINITNGQVDFTGGDSQKGKDIPGTGYTADQAKSVFASIQKSLDIFFNGYTDLLFTLGNGAAAIASLGNFNMNEVQRAWNSAASAGFADKMNAWITTGLPGLIQEWFWNPVAEGLTKLGFSSTALGNLHDTMNKMAPEDALKYVTSLVKAVQDITLQLNLLKQPMLTNEFGGINGTLWDAATQASNPYEAFLQASNTTYQDIVKLSQEIPDLVGQDQINAIQRAADEMKSFRQSLIQMIQQLQSAGKAVDSTFEALYQKYKLQTFTKGGKTDYAAEEAYLNQQMEAAKALGLSSTDPGVISAQASKVAALMDQMASLAIQANPANATAWQQWIMTEGPKIQAQFNAHLKSLVDPLIAANKRLEDAMAPVIAAFLALGTAMDKTIPRIPSAPPPVTTGPGDRGGVVGGYAATSTAVKLGTGASTDTTARDIREMVKLLEALPFIQEASERMAAQPAGDVILENIVYPNTTGSVLYDRVMIGRSG